MFVLDTNVISEVSRPKPSQFVLEWIARNEAASFLSVVTIAEIRSGIEQLAPGKRQQFLRSGFLSQIQLRFAGRILPVNTEIAEMWGQMAAYGFRVGRTMGVLDGFLAATCRVHNFALITRNTKDFDYMGISLLNPWA